jgi:hypothetical protein
MSSKKITKKTVIAKKAIVPKPKQAAYVGTVEPEDTEKDVPPIFKLPKVKKEKKVKAEKKPRNSISRWFFDRIKGQKLSKEEIEKEFIAAKFDSPLEFSKWFSWAFYKCKKTDDSLKRFSRDDKGKLIEFVRVKKEKFPKVKAKISLKKAIAALPEN